MRNRKRIYVMWLDYYLWSGTWALLKYLIALSIQRPMDKLPWFLATYIYFWICPGWSNYKSSCTMSAEYTKYWYKYTQIHFINSNVWFPIFFLPLIFIFEHHHFSYHKTAIWGIWPPIITSLIHNALLLRMIIAFLITRMMNMVCHVTHPRLFCSLFYVLHLQIRWSTIVSCWKYFSAV